VKKWVYKLFYSNMQKPERLYFTYEFRGQGSNDVLYEVGETQLFDLPMKLELINDDDFDWDARQRVKEAYSDKICKHEKALLVEARKEKYISLDDEERVTGEYIVSVRCRLQVKWTKLSYEEYTTLKNKEKE
jgi:hypothetical protein